jgi:hypothetical protein
VKDGKFTEPEVSVFNDDELEAFFTIPDSTRLQGDVLADR